jgi:hypothetical protein
LNAPASSPVVSELQLTAYRLPFAPFKISPSIHGLKLDVGRGGCPLLEDGVMVVAVDDETPPGTTLSAN